MRALLQRVKEASVLTEGSLRSHIGKGILIFLGVAEADGEEAARYLAQRCADLRIFEDGEGKMNLSVKETGGEALVVSQFTLYADTRHGNRPGFTDAAPPQAAERLYEKFVSELAARLGQEKVRTGIFRAMMDVKLVNDGPVTVMVESKEKG
jgi:D-tyrosyl-tRNA(Tyr) deacylase